MVKPLSQEQCVTTCECTFGLFHKYKHTENTKDPFPKLWFN
jgi:hypothetical protein